MKKYVNGICVEMTDEEIKELRKREEQDKAEERESFLALTYAERVEYLIRKRYTVSDEIAILRQREEKVEEFAEYNAFAEECKRIAGGET